MVEKKQLTKRLILSAILIGISYYAIFSAPNWAFVLVVEFFVLTGLTEYYVLAAKKGFILNSNLGLVFGALFPLSYYIPAESIIFTCATLCIFMFNFNRRLKDQALISTAITLFGLFYVAWFLSFLTKIRWLEHGSFWIFYAIFTVKIGDAGAYFIGNHIGTHKYAVHISPNKSTEGAIGGFAMTVLASLFSKTYLTHVPISHLLILGTIVGILGQLGDLAESLIKRDVGVKDSGNWPGLGGVLDIADSLLFVLPCIYYYVLVYQSGLLQ